EIDGRWSYLHGRGAIGDAGSQPVAVDLPDALQGFLLPDPPSGAALIGAVRAALTLLEGLAPDRVMMPLLCLTVRSLLPECAFSGHLAGFTGVGKTELAALAQQFYGAGLDARHLPASWT